MAPITTKAIVLRSIPYLDNHRILTLFSQELGRLTAVAHGSLSIKSKLRSASTLFACGEYVLKSKGERMSVDAFTPDSNYFGAISDFDAVIHASYLCALCEAVLQPGEGQRELFVLLMEALSYLCYGEAPPETVFCAYLLLMLDELGYAPEIDRCASCGTNRGTPKFSPIRGGLCCHRCAPEADDITRGMLKFLRAARAGELSTALEKSDMIILRSLLVGYCHFCIDREIKAAEMFKL